MLILAVEAEEKFRNVSGEKLFYFGLVLLALILGIVLVRRVAKVGRLVFFVVGGTVLIILMLSWIYYRSEPKFLSPLVDKIAPFFPSTPPPISKRKNPGDYSDEKKPANPAPADQPPPPKKVY
jgi:hypothetical protein